MNMAMSIEGLGELAGYEGICTAPYLDSVGVWTFGIGHTRFDGVPIPEHMERGKDLSLEYCFELFQNRIKRYEDDVNKAITIAITQYQFDALVSFHYNTGAIGKATLTKEINKGASLGTITAYFMQWVRGGGRVISGLVNRRTNEARLYCNGLYFMHGMVSVTTANIYGKELLTHSKSINVLEYIK